MAALRLSCPHCKARMTTLDPDRVKQSITCPRCRRSFTPGAVKPSSSSALDTAALDSTDPWKEEPPASFLESPHLMRWLLVGGGVVLAAVLLVAVLLLRKSSGPRKDEGIVRGGEQPGKKDEATARGGEQLGTKKDSSPNEAVVVAGKRKGAPPAGVIPPGKHALLVGVRDYDSSKLSPLKYTENDVEELAEILARPETGFANVRVLTSTRGKTKAEDAPTRANIRAAIKALVEKRKRDEMILVGLAGHGLQLEVKEGDRKKDESFFCPSDMQWNDQSSMVGLSDLFKQLDDSGAGVKLLVVDACRNDPVSGRNPDVDTVPRPARGIAALFSCSSGERAFESAKLGKGHGIFFHHFLEGLRGKAQNEDKEVTWARLTEYVSTQVPRAIPRLVGDGAKQTPHLVTNLTGSSPVLLRAGDLWRRSFDKGKELLEKHEYEPAIQALTEASQAAPGEALPYAYRALAQALRRKLPEARADCDKALELKAGLTEAVAVRARVQALSKQNDEALADAMEAVRLDGKSALALTCRSFVYLQQGKLEPALQDANKAVKLAPELALCYDDRGSVYLAKKDYAQAVADYSKAIEIAAKFPAAYTHRGDAYLAWKKTKEATADYNKGIGLDKKDAATGYLKLGVASTRDKKNDEAIQNLTEAIKLDPDYADAYNERGVAEAAKGDFDKAIADFNEAINRDPDLADAYFNRGFAYQDMGNPEKAAADFAALVKLGPTNADLFRAYRALAEVYAQQRNYDKAIEAFNAAIEVDPDYAWTWNMRGLMYAAKKMWGKAIADYTQAISLAPRYALAYYNRGSAHALNKRYKEAIANYSAAIKFEPNFPDPYLARGTVYKTLKEYAKADSDFARYKKLTGKP
jgi:tetratricopeptide (TPR) repeat protein